MKHRVTPSQTAARTEQAEVSEKVAPTSTQLTATVDIAFLADFDRCTSRRGYTRAEAVREGMRRILNECVRDIAALQRVEDHQPKNRR